MLQLTHSRASKLTPTPTPNVEAGGPPSASVLGNATQCVLAEMSLTFIPSVLRILTGGAGLSETVSLPRWLPGKQTLLVSRGGAGLGCLVSGRRRNIQQQSPRADQVRPSGG